MINPFAQPSTGSSTTSTTINPFAPKTSNGGNPFASSSSSTAKPDSSVASFPTGLGSKSAPQPSDAFSNPFKPTGAIESQPGFKKPIENPSEPSSRHVESKHARNGSQPQREVGKRQVDHFRSNDTLRIAKENSTSSHKGRAFPFGDSASTLEPLRNSSNDPQSRKVYTQLQKDGIAAPRWPSLPGDPRNKAEMTRFRETYEAYREKVRQSLTKAALIDDPNQRKTLDNAINFKGICDEMCPDYEKIQRITESDVHQPEKDSTTSFANPRKMVKKLARSAAGQEAPLPMDVRSVACLRRTMDYLIDDLLQDDENLCTLHGYLWDRTRAIRRDFTFFSSLSAEELKSQVYVLENIARFHVTALHLLSQDGKKPEDFVEQQELEQLGKALLSLRDLYDDCNVQGIKCENEADFRAYYLIFHAQDPNIMEVLQRQWRRSLWTESDQVRTAVSLVEALQNTQDFHGPLKEAPSLAASGAHHSYFRIIESPQISYTMACFAECHFPRIRRSILAAIKKGLARPKESTKDVTVEVLNKFLRFDTPKEVVAFVELHDLKFATDNTDPAQVGRQYLVLDDRRALPHPRLQHQFSQKLVESKRSSRSLPTVIHQSVFEDSALSKGNRERPGEESLFVQDSQENNGCTSGLLIDDTLVGANKDNDSFRSFPASNRLGKSQTINVQNLPASSSLFGGATPPISITQPSSLLPTKSFPAASSLKPSPQDPKILSISANPFISQQPPRSTASSQLLDNTNLPQNTQANSEVKHNAPHFFKVDSSIASTKQPSVAQPLFPNPQLSIAQSQVSNPNVDSHTNPPTTWSTPRTPHITPNPLSVTGFPIVPSQSQFNQTILDDSREPSGAAVSELPLTESLSQPKLDPSTRTVGPAVYEQHPNLSNAPPSAPISAESTLQLPALLSTSISSGAVPIPAAGIPIVELKSTEQILHDFTRWYVLGDGGLMDEFRTFLVEDILKEVYDSFVEEQEVRLLEEEKRKDLEKAEQFRQYHLSMRYFYRWRESARDKRLKNLRRSGRDQIRAFREAQRIADFNVQQKVTRRMQQEKHQSQLQDRQGELMDLLKQKEEGRKHGGDANRDADDSSVVGSDREAIAKAVRQEFGSPKPSRTPSQQTSRSQSISMARGGAKTKALRDELLGGNQPQNFRRSLPPSSRVANSSEMAIRSSMVSERWRLKAMGIVKMPDGTALPESLANDVRSYRTTIPGMRRAHDSETSWKISTTGQIPPDRIINTAYPRSSDGEANEMPEYPSNKRKRQSDHTHIPPPLAEGTKGPSHKRVMSEAEHLISELRIMREEMEEGATWFKSQNERLQSEITSRGTTPWEESS